MKRSLILALLVGLLVAMLAPRSLAADLRGHGGPVRALSVTADGRGALSGSFDSTAILWSLETASARQVFRFHAGSVNAAIFLPDLPSEAARFATAGDDGRIAIWAAGSAVPLRVLEGHEGPIVALALAPDGSHLGSAAWDGSARVWPLDGKSAPRVLQGHQGNVNGIGFLARGEVATIGYDGTLRIWPASGAARVTTFDTPLNALAIVGDATLAVGGGDGRLRLVSTSDGSVADEVEIAPTPISAIAVSGDGRTIAASGLRGVVQILDGRTLKPLRALVGPGMPVWSLAFVPGTPELLTGGNDHVVRRWDARTGAHLGNTILLAETDPLAPYGDDPGAAVYRACVACHTLQPGDGTRAGPTLHGIMGRRIASLPDYDYSPAFAGHDIVWTKETIARLFEIGPHAYTPGTKMPEQTILRAESREALVDFLERATAEKK
ncbi:hypothetical protein Sa4125_16790 [Aureimonas sp. SA4125]|uniref:c-type cytochrome n=1 Tax=Aureimonas sp. SA4125 TaxID=2826993 RepID=UPI001CC39C8E|nr:c-type cytochrome [Aureimonas sp. SA4125]BDA84137.1 hypothetical protein Sa4125_16790 [Aureimonas sp. SA4125]